MAVNWGEVFTNVTQNLVAKLPDIGASVIQAVVAKKLGPKVEAAAKPAKEPAPALQPKQELARRPGSFMASLPTWWPMAAGGAAILVVGYFLYKGKRRS